MPVDMYSMGDNTMLCPFCACPPFISMTDFDSHFIKLHKPLLFPDPRPPIGHDQRYDIARLIFYERFAPNTRYINIQMATLTGYEVKLIKNLKATIAFSRILREIRTANNSQPRLSISSRYVYDSATSPPFEVDYDNSLIEQMADLQQDVANLSQAIRHSLSSPVQMTPVDQKYISHPIALGDRHVCLFCDRVFTTKSGLGLHKKAHPHQEFLLEIEHRSIIKRNHQWDEESACLSPLSRIFACRVFAISTFSLQRSSRIAHILRLPKLENLSGTSALKKTWFLRVIIMVALLSLLLFCSLLVPLPLCSAPLFRLPLYLLMGRPVFYLVMKKFH